MKIGPIIEKLANLYELTEMDWCFSISGSITEPTCPVVTIYPEDEDYDGLTNYTEFCDLDGDVDVALEKVVARVFADVYGDAEQQKSSVPFTNPADDLWKKKLIEIRAKRGYIE